MTKATTLKQDFEKKILPELQKELGIKNKMAVPRLKLIKVNVGIGSYLSRSGSKDPAPIVESLGLIAGQKPVITNAKKAISNFKLREGMPVGVTTTLRGERMYDFINKLVNIVLPRVRDFRGISKKSFDGRGNYSLGLKEHLVFPEINPDDITKSHGVQITIKTSTNDDEEGFKLLTKLGFPFKENKPSIK